MPRKSFHSEETFCSVLELNGILPIHESFKLVSSLKICNWVLFSVVFFPYTLCVCILIHEQNMPFTQVLRKIVITSNFLSTVMCQQIM